MLLTKGQVAQDEETVAKKLHFIIVWYYVVKCQKCFRAQMI